MWRGEVLGWAWIWFVVGIGTCWIHDALVTVDLVNALLERSLLILGYQWALDAGEAPPNTTNPIQSAFLCVTGW